MANLLLEFFAVGVDGVAVGQAELDAILIEVVGHRELAAEGVAATGDRQLARGVGEGMHQHRHAQAGEADRIGHAFFVAKVGQRHQDAVNAILVALKKLGALLSVGPALDRAEVGALLIDNHNIDAKVSQPLQDFLAAFRHQRVGEEVAVANNHAQCGIGAFHNIHLELFG